MNSKQSIVVLLGLALIGLHYWFSPQRSTLGPLVAGSSSSSSTTRPANPGAGGVGEIAPNPLSGGVGTGPLNSPLSAPTVFGA